LARKALDATIGDRIATHWVPHDLRRSCASGMARLGVAIPTIEKVLNHRSGTFRGIVGVYQHYDFAAEMKVALNRWSDHVAAVVADELDRRINELQPGEYLGRDTKDVAGKLSEWLKTKYPHAPPCSTKAIQNNTKLTGKIRPRVSEEYKSRN
jgi:hypothetical protein